MTPAQSTLVHFRNRVFLKGGTKRAKATPPSLCFDSEKQGRKLLRVDWWTYLYTLRERESIGEVLGNHLGRATTRGYARMTPWPTRWKGRAGQSDVWITLNCPNPSQMLYSSSVSCAGLAWLASH